MLGDINVWSRQSACLRTGALQNRNSLLRADWELTGLLRGTDEHILENAERHPEAAVLKAWVTIPLGIDCFLHRVA